MFNMFTTKNTILQATFNCYWTLIYFIFCKMKKIVTFFIKFIYKGKIYSISVHWKRILYKKIKSKHRISERKSKYKILVRQHIFLSYNNFIQVKLKQRSTGILKFIWRKIFSRRKYLHCNPPQNLSCWYDVYVFQIQNQVYVIFGEHVLVFTFNWF